MGWLSRQPNVPLSTVPTRWTTTGKSRRAGTGGTGLLKMGWFEGMVVAEKRGPLWSPVHRTVTALIVLLGEEGIWLEGVVFGAVDGGGGGTVELDIWGRGIEVVSGSESESVSMLSHFE
jgi:hypothetical protein